MIKGFRKFTVTCNGVALSVHRGGQGKPLLLLHGFPQNHMCWERVAPQLARSRDVIIPDLRGYGESEAPPNESGNITYSKRTMAQDIRIYLMHWLYNVQMFWVMIEARALPIVLR